MCMEGGRTTDWPTPLLSSVIPAVTSPRLSPKRLGVECWRSQAASVHPRTQHSRSRGSTFCRSLHFDNFERSKWVSWFIFIFFKATYRLTWLTINITSAPFFFAPSERDSHLKLHWRSNFRRLFVTGPMCASRAAGTGYLCLTRFHVVWSSLLRQQEKSD